jgi:ABC-type glutathione transport system ATPase component
MAAESPLLDVALSVDYPNKPGTLRNITFSMGRGEVLGLVGESGSGKSTIALALLRLLRFKQAAVTGQVIFKGRNLLLLSEKEMAKVRGREIGLILQSPLASLNPELRIGTQVAEAWQAHISGGRTQRDEAVGHALLRVGLPADKEFRRRYPAQISVGQAQRVLIAMAVMHSPSLLVADEPTSALDAISQMDILNTLVRLNRQTGTAMLYVSHDLQSVAGISRRLAILRAGEIVECGLTLDLLQNPRHPYTRQLLGISPWLQWWAKHPYQSRIKPRYQNEANATTADVTDFSALSFTGLKSPLLSVDM